MQHAGWEKVGFQNSPNKHKKLKYKNTKIYTKTNNEIQKRINTNTHKNTQKNKIKTQKTKSQIH